MKPKHLKAAGMTLMELMVVMAIVGILAAIAFPAYQNYVMRTHRAAARACVSETAQFLERFYTTNQTYEGADITLGCMSDLDTKYTFTADLFPRDFAIRAAPIGAQEDRDKLCGTLVLQADGTRRMEGSTGTREECWR